MRSIKKWFHREHGQSLILVVIAMTMLCGVAALVIDVGRVSVSQGQLQNAADSAALAAARELPSATNASIAAKKYAGYNGVLSANTTATTPYNGNANRVEVVCKETVDYTFAKVIGLNNTEVSARAVAEKGGISGGPFGYTLFSGSTNGTLTMNSYDFTVGGSLHSNANVALNGTLQTITGNAEAVKNFTLNGYNQTIGDTLQGATITLNGSNMHVAKTLSVAAADITMPDFSAEAINEATASGTVYNSSKDFSGYDISVDTNIYVKGDITVNATKFTGKGIMVATGSIYLNGYMMSNATGSSVCMFANKSGGQIVINGTGITINGILYAPFGSIIINGYDITINGRIIAKDITINGTKIKIISGANDLACLPGGTIVLVE